MRVKNAALAIAGAICDGPSARVLFEYNAGSSVSGLGGTFARADASTCARYRDSNGIWQVVAANVLRDQHFPTPSVGPTTLLEPTRTNSALGSCSWADGTYWSGDANWTLASATSCLSGQTAYKHTSIGLAIRNRFQAIGTFVNGQTDCVSAIVELPTSNAADKTAIAIVDATLSAFLVKATLTWSTLSIAVDAGAGTCGVIDLGTGPNGGKMARVWVCGTGTAAGTGAAGNTRTPYLYLTAYEINTTACILHHAQFEAAASFPTSPIVTVGSAVTRAADALSFPFAPVPQAMTIYVKSVACTNFSDGSKYLFSISDAAVNNPAFYSLIGGGQSYQIRHNNGISSVVGTCLLVPSLGDTVEWCGSMSALGAVQTEQSINSGTSVVGSASASLTPLAAAWSGATLYLNNAGTLAGYQSAIALQSVKIDAGFQSLNTLRAL